MTATGNAADAVSSDRMTPDAGTVHIDYGAAVSVRMPTPEECARGYPEGAPVMVVADGVRDKVFPRWVTLTFDDPHGTPEPDAVQQAARYVLHVIGEQLDLAAGQVADLAGAFRRSPCSVVDLAGEVREREDDAWHCVDASMCNRQPVRLDQRRRSTTTALSGSTAHRADVVSTESLHVP